MWIYNDDAYGTFFMQKGPFFGLIPGKEKANLSLYVELNFSSD